MHVELTKSKRSIECTRDDIIKLIKSGVSKNDEVWISEFYGSYPVLVLHLNEDNVCIDYFEKDTNIIWTSFSSNLKEIEYIAGGEEWEAPNDVTVTIEEAIKCVNEFCSNFNKPTCIRWQNLI